MVMLYGTSLLLAAMRLQFQEASASHTDTMPLEFETHGAEVISPKRFRTDSIDCSTGSDDNNSETDSVVLMQKSVRAWKSAGPFHEQMDQTGHFGRGRLVHRDDRLRNATYIAAKIKAEGPAHRGMVGKILKICADDPPVHPAALKARIYRTAVTYSRFKEQPGEPAQPAEGSQITEPGKFDITATTGMHIFDVFLIVAFGVFAVNSVNDTYKFWLLLVREKKDLASEVPSRTTDGQEEKPVIWSASSLIGLTAYRFYTGFLTGTWLPYLLAMEGQYLWSENQSMFMGCAKLIYGATILTNPILGLMGDRAVLLSLGIGRRLFVRIGVALAGLGIVICLIAGSIAYFYTFMFGILVWRLGGAVNDVTTEILVPELVPPEQFGFASAIKAAMFLVGGLFGYVLLIFAADIEYTWLYYAYLLGMITTCIPVLIMLDDDAPRLPRSGSRRTELDFSEAMTESYFVPTRTKGGFPRACLAVFVFSLGTAPMFFLLLLVRDIVGVRDPVALQQHFSGSSLMFFVSAALAAVMTGTKPPGPNANQSAKQVKIQDGDSPLVKEILQMTYSVSIFAVMCFLFPWVFMLPTVHIRLIVFYVVATITGFVFGLAFSQFQGITWQLIPPGTDLANAMGFNVMCRLLGIGVGNFIAGVLLDFFYADVLVAHPTGNPDIDGGYTFPGYVLMCSASGVATLVSSMLAYSIAVQYRGLKGKNNDCIVAAG